MDTTTTTYIKNESPDSAPQSTGQPSPQAVNSVFDAYINSDFLDENSGSSAPTIPSTLPVDIPTPEMLCYFMDSEGLNGNIAAHLMDQSSMFYLDPHLIQSYQNELALQSCQLPNLSSSSENAPVTTNIVAPRPSQLKKKSLKRKPRAGNSPYSLGSEEVPETPNGSRPDLMLTPDELSMISKASPKERRQIRNKISARNFRLRRKEYVNNLEEKANRFDEETETLREVINQAEHDKAYLRSCVDDLMCKFKLLTDQIPDLKKFSGLDPLRDLTMSSDGQLVSVASLASTPTQQSGLATCRGASSYDSAAASPENIPESSLPSRFPSSRSRSFMVKA